MIRFRDSQFSALDRAIAVPHFPADVSKTATLTNQRNLILAVVLTGLLLLGWDAGLRYFYPQPNKPVVAAAAPVASGAPEIGRASCRERV